MSHVTLALLASLALIGNAHAGEAHVHGEGRLEVAVEKDVLTIALELPLDVAVGFERAPANAKEREAIAQSLALLKSGEGLFVPTPAAGCKLESSAATTPVTGPSAGAVEHADIDARYVFRCASPAALKGVETGLFKHFKRLYRLEAQRVSAGGQGKARLTPKQPSISW